MAKLQFDYNRLYQDYVDLVQSYTIDGVVLPGQDLTDTSYGSFIDLISEVMYGKYGVASPDIIESVKIAIVETINLFKDLRYGVSRIYGGLYAFFESIGNGYKDLDTAFYKFVDIVGEYSVGELIKEPVSVSAAHYIGLFDLESDVYAGKYGELSKDEFCVVNNYFNSLVLLINSWTEEIVKVFDNLRFNGRVNNERHQDCV